MVISYNKKLVLQYSGIRFYLWLCKNMAYLSAKKRVIVCVVILEHQHSNSFIAEQLVCHCCADFAGIFRLKEINCDFYI